MKKCLTTTLVVLMSVALIVTSTGAPAFAAENVSLGKEKSSAVTEEPAEFEGDNSFGRMMTDLMSEKEAEQTAHERFITDLSVEGKNAKVEFFTNRDAELVVGIYSDDSEEDMHLIASGEVNIYPEMDEAEVEIDIDEMPEYFISVAYMLDPDTHEPISEENINRMNTKELREVMEKTMADYDQEDVLDLDTDDEDIQTNYAVINESTKRFETVGDRNKVTTADETSQTYVIENADSALKELQEGDTFILDQGNDNIIIGIVLSISADGDTVTIVTDPDATFEDVFDIIKLDETAKAEDCTFEPSEEATELGIDIKTETTGNEESSLKKIDAEASGNFEVKAKGTFLNKKVDDNNYVKLTGSLGLAFEPSVKMVLCKKYQYLKVEFPIIFTAELEFQAKGTAQKKTPMKLGVAGAYFGPVKLSVDIAPQFSVTSTGSLSYKAKIFCGAVYDSQAKAKLKPYVGAKTEGVELSAKLEVFLGLSIAPTASIIDQAVAKTDFKAKVGFLVTASNSTKITYDASPVVHLCGSGNCIDGDVDFQASITYEVEFLSWLTYTKELKEFTVHIKDFYYSFKYGDHGFGECPHQLNKVTATIVDDEGSVSGATISAKNLSSGKTAKIYKVSGSTFTEITPSTNKNGQATFYLPYGQFRLTAKKNEIMSGSKKIKLHGEDKKVEIVLKEGASGSDPGDPDDPDDPTSPNTGYCGRFLYTEPKVPDDGNGEKNIKWTLSDDGTLTLEGTGDMRSYNCTYESADGDSYELLAPPWQDKVTNIVFKGDINSIGLYAFYDCDKLTSVTLPETLSETEEYIEDEGFTYTHGGLESSAFSYCDNLKQVIIPKNTKLTWIWDSSFRDCESLTYVQLPDSLKYISDEAFSGCSNLETITIPDNVVEIGKEAFAYSGLKTIHFNNKLRAIWGHAFVCCPLTSLTIPASVKRIGGQAFGFNDELTEVYFKGDAPEINTTGEEYSMGTEDDVDDEYDHYLRYEDSGSPFTGCDGEITAYIPAGNSSWTNEMKFLYEHDDPNYTPPEEPEDPDDPDAPSYYDPHITWKTWTPSKGASSNTITSNGLSVRSVNESSYTYDGDVLVSEFEELVPNEEYVLVVVKDPEAGDLLATDNLLYIWQDRANENGQLTFRYLLREEAEEEPYILLYGAGGESIDEAGVNLAQSEYTYTGERIYPKVSFGGSYNLEEGVDYEITGDTSAIYPGTYSVTITCKGDFYGSKTLDYIVKKGVPSLFGHNKRITVGQKTNLQIENTSDAKQTVVSSNRSVATVTNSGSVTARKPGTAWMTISVPETDNYTKATYKAKITVVPKPVRLTSAKNIKSRKIKATWKKGSMITGYELQYSLKKSFKGAKTVKIKKTRTTTRTISKLKKKKTYFLRIRTYKKIGTKIYRSNWSAVKIVRIKY